MKIYVVFGKTGRYDDFRTWPVIAYKDKQSAKDHEHNAFVWANILKEKLDEEGKSFFLMYDEEKPASPYDDNLDMDSNGTEYYIQEIEMIE